MQTEGLFPIPVYWAQTNNLVVQSRFESIHEQLTKDGKFRYKEGWNTHKLSDPDFKSNLIEENCLTEFKEELGIHLEKYLETVGFDTHNQRYMIKSSWMTSYNKGDYSHQHCHATADIAGVYYVKAAEADADFYIRSPNKNMTASYVFKFMPDTLYYQPTVGKIILFPGWLDHGVGTQLADSERVSVSFNLQFERL